MQHLDDMKKAEEIMKLRAEIQKIMRESDKLLMETRWYPMVVMAGIFGAIFAIAKFFIK